MEKNCTFVDSYYTDISQSTVQKKKNVKYVHFYRTSRRHIPEGNNLHFNTGSNRPTTVPFHPAISNWWAVNPGLKCVSSV